MRDSAWKVTWAPAAETPRVLIGYDDLMDDEIARDVIQLVDIGRFDQAATGLPYGRGNKKRRLELTRIVEFDSASEAWQAMIDAADSDPWKSKELLRITPLSGSIYVRAALLSVSRETVNLPYPGYREKLSLRIDGGLTPTGGVITIITGWFNDPIEGGGTTSGGITIVVDDASGLAEGDIVYVSGVSGVTNGHYPVTGVSGNQVTVGSETDNEPRLIASGVTGGSEAGTVELEFDGVIYLDGMTGGGTYEVSKPGLGWETVAPDGFGRAEVACSPSSIITYGNPPLGLTNAWQGAENGDVLELNGQQHANPSGGINPVDESGPTAWVAKLRHNGVEVDSQEVSPSWATSKTWQDSGPADHVIPSGQEAVFTLHASGPGSRLDTGVANQITGGTIQKAT